ncbi:MAG TPA: hypothetical protein VGO65_05260 [Pseudolysinimonas sp.]|jgi:hypothetical protein|nr:hypothetical protein [Pseudolysinimonas sp.]
MTAPRLALLGAIAATLLLAGCSAPTPQPADDGPTPTPSTPTVVSLADLDYPYDSPETLTSLADARTDLENWYDEYTSSCTTEQAASTDSPDCTEGIITTLQKVNAIKTVFDFSWSADDFASGDYSGLVALEPTKTSIQKASDDGSDVVDACYYVPGGAGCADKVQGFLDLVADSLTVMTAWEA